MLKFAFVRQADSPENGVTDPLSPLSRSTTVGVKGVIKDDEADVVGGVVNVDVICIDCIKLQKY